MPNINTDFVRIGQSGPTIDGRNIDPQWLCDAAEQYDTKVYTALIWPDHMRFLGNYGSVLALKCQQEGDVVALYAQLRPNTSLHIDNQRRQNIFTSMELQPDFAGTGKAYLIGLGVTDSPASLGTDELHFSLRKHSQENFILPGTMLNPSELTALGAAPAGDADTDTPPSWFTKLFGGLMPSGQGTNKQEDNMDEKQFTEIKGDLAALTAQMQDLSAKFAAQTEAKEVPPTPAEGESKTSEDKTAEVLSSLASLKQEFTALSTRLEQAKPGTTAAETTSPAETAGII